MNRRPRFVLVERDAGGFLHAGNLTVVELWDRQDADYIGSMPMTGEQRSALVAELTAVAAVRSLHSPCHEPGTPSELCVGGREHADGDVPACRECGKPFPCPTAEVLPS